MALIEKTGALTVGYELIDNVMMNLSAC